MTRDKYGVLRSDLYGNACRAIGSPAYRDLISTTTHARLKTGEPSATWDPIRGWCGASEVTRKTPSTWPGLHLGLRYRIPTDIDHLMSEDACRATTGVPKCAPRSHPS